MSTDQEEKKEAIKISGVVMSVKILGTGSFLPEKSVSNDDLSKVMDTMMNGFHPGQGFAAGTFRLKIQHQRWQ